MKSHIVTLALLATALVTPNLASAAAKKETGPVWNVRYYSGTSHFVDVPSNTKYDEEVVFYQIFDPLKKLITEVACYKDPGADAGLSSTYMKVAGSDLNVSDSAKFENSPLSGKGKVKGAPYRWTEFDLTMQYKLSDKPDDHIVIASNFKISDTKIEVKKHVTFADGKPKQDWDSEIPRVTKEAFLKKASDMKCPAIP